MSRRITIDLPDGYSLTTSLYPYTEPPVEPSVEEALPPGGAARLKEVLALTVALPDDAPTKGPRADAYADGWSDRGNALVAMLEDLAKRECPVCGSGAKITLDRDWQERVGAGEALPVVGCGNPWHYLFTTDPARFLE